MQCQSLCWPWKPYGQCMVFEEKPDSEIEARLGDFNEYQFRPGVASLRDMNRVRTQIESQMVRCEKIEHEKSCVFSFKGTDIRMIMNETAQATRFERKSRCLSVQIPEFCARVTYCTEVEISANHRDVVRKCDPKRNCWQRNRDRTTIYERDVRGEWFGVRLDFTAVLSRDKRKTYEVEIEKLPEISMKQFLECVRRLCEVYMRFRNAE